MNAGTWCYLMGGFLGTTQLNNGSCLFSGLWAVGHRAFLTGELKVLALQQKPAEDMAEEGPII